MGFVFAIAIGLAALRNADDTWAGIMLLLAFGLLGVALVGTICERGRPRAWWVGFLVFEGAYLALIFGTWFPERLQSKLATTLALNYVHDQVRPYEEEKLLLASFRAERRALQAQIEGVKIEGQSPVDLPPERLKLELANTDLRIGQLRQHGLPFNRWPILLPGAANQEVFVRVGHCLFAMLAGISGACIACRFHARQERNEERAGN